MDTLMMALRSLRAHVLRSALTLLGIVIGITAVVGMSAVIRGVDNAIMGQISAMNPHVVYLMRAGLITTEEQWLKAMRRPDITLEDLRAIEDDCESVGKVDLFAIGSAPLVRGPNRTRQVDIQGVGVNYLDVNAMTIDRGRYFTPGEVQAGARVMLLARDPIEVLFGQVDPVGRAVRLFGQEYTVIGTFAPQGEVGGMNFGQDNFAVIPYTTHKRDVSVRMRGCIVAMIPREGVSLERMQEDVTAIMRRRHRLRANQDDDFALVTQASVLKFWQDISGAIFLGLTGISSIALLVGGIGIMAVMMVAVTERTREIGVRRALGARRWRILAQFLTEAALLAAAGGAIGSAVGTGVAVGVGKLVDLPVATPWDTFVVAIAVSASVGIVFGVVPAWRAARLNVVEALRAE